MEQVNIEGRRSGEGFVAHKDTLTNALGRVMARRVILLNDSVTVERKGLLGYLKALTGNIVKIAPANGDASGLRVTEKGLRVVCGSHKGFIPDGAWLKDNIPQTFCQVRILPKNSVTPNLGGAELAEALSRVLPFVSGDEDRPALACVKVEIKEGKLTLIGADGFRLAIDNLDLAEGEGEVLIHRDDVKDLIPALKRAKRVRLSIQEQSDNGKMLARYLVADTELVSYKLPGQDGEYPKYDQVMPTEFVANASFDTKAAIKACQNLLALWFDDDTKPMFRPLALTVSDGKLTIETKEGRDKAEIEAETEGEGRVAVNGKYLVETLKACGGIVKFQVSSPTTAMSFSADGYQALVMPVVTEEGKRTQGEAEAQEAEPQAQEPEAQSQGNAKGKGKGKGKAKAQEQEPEAQEAEAVGVS